jgi:urea transport system ATP-binding protein
VLELINVDSYYRNSRALQGVSMSVGKGEFLSVLGRNGVGKTTLMRAILGLMDKTTGSIKLEGVELLGKDTYERAKAGIGYVPQGRGILPAFTVRENLRLGTFASKSKSKEIDEWIFDLFPVLREFLNRRGGNLSGGQQQQLAIGRALLTEPKVILLDEPTEGIQPNIVEQIEKVLVDLNSKHGITVVLVEQNVEFARRASQRFVILDRGSVAIQGVVSELTDELVHQHMAV